MKYLLINLDVNIALLSAATNQRRESMKILNCDWLPQKDGTIDVDVDKSLKTYLSSLSKNNHKSYDLSSAEKIGVKIRKMLIILIFHV